MKKLLFVLGFVGFFQVASAQDAATTNTDLVVKVTLSETVGEKAKLLKNLKYGELFKGESRTEFLIRTSAKKAENLSTELTELFPGCRLEKVSNKK